MWFIDRLKWFLHLQYTSRISTWPSEPENKDIAVPRILVPDAELENYDLGLVLKPQDSMIHSNGTNQHDPQLKNVCSLNSRIDDKHIAIPLSSELDAETGKYDGRLDTETLESIANSKGMQPHTNARNVFIQFFDRW